MKRWSDADAELKEIPEIDAFLAEIDVVCRRHKLCISHEDHHGKFEIVNYDHEVAAWLAGASDERLEK